MGSFARRSKLFDAMVGAVHAPPPKRFGAQEAEPPAGDD